MNTIIEQLVGLRPEQVRTFTLACLVLMAGAFYWHFTSRLVPLRRQASQARDEFEDDDRACTKLRRKLRRLLDEQVGRQARMRALAAAAGELQRGYQEMAAAMVRPAQIPEVERRIAFFARRTGVRLLALDKRVMRRQSVAGLPPPFVRRRYVLECASTFPAAVAFLAMLEQVAWPVRVARVIMREARGERAGILVSVELDLITPEADFRGRPPVLASITCPPPPRIRDRFPPRSPPRRPKAKTAAKVEFGQLALTGIVGSGKERVAVLNGQVIRKGSTVNGARVELVDEDRVVLSKGGVRRQVRLRSMAEMNTPTRPQSEKE